MSMDYDFTIASLGEAKIDSPIPYSTVFGDARANFVREDEYILYDVEARMDNPDNEKPQLHDANRNIIEKAGPREQIYVRPGHVHAAIITCGGLCPGLNDVIRAVVRTLWHQYGVRRISGIQYGFQGLLPEYNYPPIPLDAENVDDIHNMGGTILGSSRGGGKRVEELVDSLERSNINMVFIIGGDGTQRGSSDIADEIHRRGLKIAVVGIPKTIDNDLRFVQKSFGFETAVSKAVEAVSSAHIEAKSAPNGIGLVKVMGRESGFIAAHTALSSNDVNFILIPEVGFDLEGPNGLLAHLKSRLDRRDHAVILVAEGAGQDLMPKSNMTDASGNIRLSNIGLYLKQTLKDRCEAMGMEVNLKYIDPSYMIRSSAAQPSDSLYCARLGATAVHAAMAGKTKLLISQWNTRFVHIPIHLAVAGRNKVNPESSLWRDVLETTRQPILMKNPTEKKPAGKSGKAKGQSVQEES